ncbi:hypothetical protein MNBD_CHLOROFLEXI01-3619 [hydrothermal vent metagenome]|uniref:Ferric oxidoreductase domain-containing protein n=1 Tax=hydrothermal vent metagenome TaxID=652676 RepID=A0A3B0VJ37_9ZZZZ
MKLFLTEWCITVMTWLRKQKWWLLLNLLALGIFIIVLTQGSINFNTTHTFDPGLASGKWGVRFLLLSLAMTPLNSYFGWRGAIRLRKPAGLWAFGFTAVHLLFYFLFYIEENQFLRLIFSLQTFIVLGLLSFLLLSALAVTSNKWAMRRLKKNWKRLHRLVYLAGIFATFHAILATNASKRIFARDPDVLPELILYFLLLILLLGVRIAFVRRVLQKMWAGLFFWQPQRNKMSSPS